MFGNWKGIEAKSRRLLPLTCLPVDDILDVVVHALVVSSSVGLEVKSHLGEKKKVGTDAKCCWFPFIIYCRYTAVSTQQ